MGGINKSSVLSGLEDILQEQGIDLYGNNEIRTMVSDYLYSKKRGYDNFHFAIRNELTKFFGENTELQGKSKTEYTSRVILEMNDIAKMIDVKDIGALATGDSLINKPVLQRDFIELRIESILNNHGLDGNREVLLFSTQDMIEARIIADTTENDKEKARFEDIFNEDRKSLRSTIKTNFIFQEGIPVDKIDHAELGARADEVLERLMEIAYDNHAIAQVQYNKNNVLDYFDKRDKPIDDDLVAEVFGLPKRKIEPKPEPQPEIPAETKIFLSGIVPALQKNAQKMEKENRYVDNASKYYPIEKLPHISIRESYSQVQKLFLVAFFPETYEKVYNRDTAYPHKQMNELFDANVAPENSLGNILKYGMNVIEIKLKKLTNSNPRVQSNLQLIEDDMVDSMKTKMKAFLAVTKPELGDQIDAAVDKFEKGVDNMAREGYLHSPRYFDIRGGGTGRS